MNRKPTCRACGDRFHPARFQAGYKVCLPCGEDEARAVRHTVAPLHKSNYMLITSRTDLAGLNNKGGLVR
jgi:ribosomal protein L37AE/L43A